MLLLSALLACGPGTVSLRSDSGDTSLVDTEAPPIGDTGKEVIPGSDDTGEPEDTDDSEAVEEATYQAFYDPGVVQTIALELSRGAIQSLRVDPFTYVEGKVTVNGQLFEQVGIRLKGSSSYQDFDGKPAFKVKFNAFVVGQKFAGLERITLNNMVGDPTQSKEMIGYALFTEMGLLVPRVSYARVSLNGELQGLYTNLESMDDHLLDRHYSDGSGDLWEGNDYADFTRHGLSYFELVTGVGDYAALETVQQTLAGAPPAAFLEEADTVIDMESFLDFWAYSIAIGNKDGYPYNVNDYFVYRDVADGRFDFAPWGMDESWDTGMVWSYAGGEVALGCMRDEDCVSALYTHTADALLAYEAMDIESWALGVWELSEPLVEEDLRRPYTIGQVMAERATLLTRINRWPGRVRRQMGIEEPG